MTAKQNKKKEKKSLTVRQERFCELVAAGKTLTDAYIEAGYNVSRNTARANAAASVAKHSIADRIAELRAPQTKKTLLSRDRKRELLAQIAENTAMKPLVRIRAIETDAKIAGHFEPEHHVIEGGNKTLEAIRERALKVASALSSAGDLAQPRRP
jgi:phage terminase small subunit